MRTGMFDKHGEMVALLLLPILAVSCARRSTVGGIRSTPPPKTNEALVLLTGYTGGSEGMEKVTKYFQENSEYYAFNAQYKSGKGFSECVKGLKEYLSEIEISRFDKAHFFCFIMGGIALRELLKEDSIPNLGNIVLNRAPLQERIAHVVIESYPDFLLRRSWGETIFDMDTLDLNFRDFGGCEAPIGLFIETKVSSVLKYHIRQIRGLGELSFEPGKLLKEYSDYAYIPLDHNEMYDKPEVYGELALRFLRTGSFGDLADREYSGEIEGIYPHHQCVSCMLGAFGRCCFIP